MKKRICVLMIAAAAALISNGTRVSTTERNWGISLPVAQAELYVLDIKASQPNFFGDGDYYKVLQYDQEPSFNK